MPGNLKFPPSTEIKRAIAAAERAGIRISSIEIHPRKIIILAKERAEQPTKELSYAEWKAKEKLQATLPKN